MKNKERQGEQIGQEERKRETELQQRQRRQPEGPEAAGGRGQREGLCWLKPKDSARGRGDPSGRGGGLAAVKRAHPERRSAAPAPRAPDSPAWRGPWPSEGHGRAAGLSWGGGGGPANNAGL